MREKLPEFEKLSVRLACIVQGNGKDAAELCGPFGLTANCVPDPKSESYQKLGLDRTTWMELLRPSHELRRRRKENRDAGFSIHFKRSFRGTCDILLLPGAALVAAGAGSCGCIAALTLVICPLATNCSIASAEIFSRRFMHYRFAPKNSFNNMADSSAKTPHATSTRWLSCGWSRMEKQERTAPPLASSAP